MSNHSNANESGYVERQVGRVSRNLLIWNGAVLLALATIAFLLRAYLECFFRGPQRIDDTFILQAANGPNRELIAYVEIQNHPLLTTGYVEKSSQNGKVYSTNPYYFIAIRDKLMLVKASANEQGAKLTGPLQSISVYSDQKVLESIIAEAPSLKDKVLPVMLNAAAAFDVFGYIFFGSLIPVVALCGFNIARATVRFRWMNCHPVIRSLARYGPFAELVESIDAEVVAETTVRVGKALLTRNWLIRPTAFRLIVCRLDDIVWAFHAVIWGDNVASFAFQDGRMFGVPVHQNTPELLSLVYQRVPWTEKGWDLETAKRWRIARAAFIANVEARKGNSSG